MSIMLVMPTGQHLHTILSFRNKYQKMLKLDYAFFESMAEKNVILKMEIITESPLFWETHFISCQRSLQMYADAISSICAPLKYIVQIYVV